MNVRILYSLKAIHHYKFTIILQTIPIHCCKQIMSINYRQSIMLGKTCLFARRNCFLEDLKYEETGNDGVLVFVM